MRESRTSGSVRGDRGNPVPYRHRHLVRRQKTVQTLDIDHRSLLNLFLNGGD